MYSENNLYIKIFKLFGFLVILITSCKTPSRTHINRTFLQATEKGDFEKVKLLLKNGADINSKAHDGFNAVYKASENGHFEIVKFLLNNGAEIYCDNNAYHNTPLDIASLNGHYKIVDLLIPYSKKNIEYSQALSSATANGHYKVVNLILTKIKHKIDLKPAIKKAAISNRIIILKLLQKYGADFNSTDLLSYAAKSESLSMVKFVFNNINVNSRINSKVLISATEKARIRILVFLLKNIQSKKYLPFALRLAAKSGKQDVVKLLLKYGANVNAKYSYGGSALFEAVAYFRHNVMKILLKHGANVNYPYRYHKFKHNLYKNGFTPLMSSVKNNDFESFSYLINSVKKVDQAHLSTCLSLAIENNNEKIFNALLKLITNINVAGIYGKISLISASKNAGLYFVKNLLQRKANIDLKDNKGQSALSAAVLSEKKDIIDVLLEYGANVNYNSEKIIYNCVVTNNIDMLKYLNLKGLKITNANASRCLIAASGSGLINFVEFFNNNNIDLNLSYGKNKITALISAIRKNRIKIVKYLIMFNVNLNAGTKNGLTPLIASVMFNRIKILRILVDAGADINKRGAKNMTPLEWAKFENNKKAVNVLTDCK